MAGNGRTPSGRRQPRVVRERAARPDLAGQRRRRLARQKRRQRVINPVWLWCSWYRIAVVDAPRKYHKPLTNVVGYGQLLTVENGR
jgi:hypothetical protein